MNAKPLRLVAALVLAAPGLARAAPAQPSSAIPLPPPPVLAPARPAQAIPSPPPPAPPSGQAAAVDVAMRRLGDSLATALARVPGARYMRFAVLDMSEVGPEAKRRQLGVVVCAELATNLRRDHGLLLVERSRLGSVLAEAKLQTMLGNVDPSQAQRIGALADAQAIVVGSVADAGDRFLVNARVVSAGSAETLAAASEPVGAASLVALSSDAVVLRSRKDALFRSLVMPGWGQAYNRQPAKAMVVGGTFATLLAGAATLHVLGSKAEDDYRTRNTAAALGSDPAAAADSLRRKAESRYAWRNGLLLGAGAVWAAGAVDAWASGVDGDALAIGVAPSPGGMMAVVGGRFGP